MTQPKKPITLMVREWLAVLSYLPENAPDLYELILQETSGKAIDSPQTIHFSPEEWDICYETLYESQLAGE